MYSQFMSLVQIECTVPLTLVRVGPGVNRVLIGLSLGIIRLLNRDEIRLEITESPQAKLSPLMEYTGLWGDTVLQVATV